MNPLPDDIYKFCADDEHPPTAILIIGGPGCGKGTQCEVLKKQFDIIHLSIGDVLREERKKDTKEGKLLDGYMKEFETNGTLMPWEVTFNMLFRYIIDNGWNKKLFLIDGFVKDFTICKRWDTYIRPLIDLKMVIYLECKPEVLRYRLKKRSETSNRKDESISEVRIKTFIERTLPSIDYFQKYPNTKFVSINAERKIEEVSEDLITVVSEVLDANK